MTTLDFDYRGTGVDMTKIALLRSRLVPEIKQLQEVAHNSSTDYAFINIINDATLFNLIKELVYEKKKLQPSLLLIVGIGGSNLGTLAIQQALYGMFYNDYNPPIKTYFVDTVDTDYVNDILLLTNQVMERGETVLLNIVSKSGTTTESIANFAIFLALFKAQYGDEYQHYIIATTDYESPLWLLAEEEKFTRLPIPRKLGGRFSVFSAVSLFPLAMIDIDIYQLLAGARDSMSASLNEDISTNHAALSAAYIYELYQQGIAVNNFFTFSVDLQGVGAWYRQLLAESISKSHLLSGEKREVGILPTVAIGSTDLHSLAQFYLAAPISSYTTFVSVIHNKSDLMVPANQSIEKLIKNIPSKSLASIMKAILQGTQQAYHVKSRPFTTITLQEKSAYCIGQLLQHKMMEIIYLAFLLNINPFDQDEVELYKHQTRRILDQG